HTHDAPSALIRLLDMGVPSYLINATVTLILAQRLVRVLCLACREQCSSLTDQEKALLKYLRMHVQQAYRAKGCNLCNQRGYKGRIGMFELLSVSSNLREQLNTHASYDKLYE